MTQVAILDQAPQDALLLQGRRHAREALSSAMRYSRKAGGSEDSATVSLALQFTVSAAMVDGTDAQDVYAGLTGAVIWALNRLPEDDRAIVLRGMLEAIAAGVELPASPLPH